MIGRWLRARGVALAAAGRWLRALVTPSPPSATEPAPGTFDYARVSVYRWLPWVVLLSLPADGLLLAVILPNGWDIVGWVILALTLWSLVWIAGVAMTMRERPHRVSRERVELHNGMLASASFAPAQMAAVSLHPGFAPGDARARAYRRGAAVLTTGLGPFVEVRLREPITLTRVATSRQVTRLIVPASDAAALHAALLEAARPSAERA